MSKLWADRIKLPAALLVISKRNSGKSFLLNSLLADWAKKRRFDGCVIMSATAHLKSSKDYLDVRRTCRKMNIPLEISDFSVDRINSLIQYQKNSKQPFKNLLLLCDDVFGQVGTRVTKKGQDSGIECLGNLATLSRHYNITQILSAQRARVVVSPSIRSNTDYLLVSKVNNDNAKICADICMSEHKRVSAMLQRLDQYEYGLYDNLAHKGGWKFVKVSHTPKKSINRQPQHSASQPKPQDRSPRHHQHPHQIPHQVSAILEASKSKKVDPKVLADLMKLID